MFSPRVKLRSPVFVLFPPSGVGPLAQVAARALSVFRSARSQVLLCKLHFSLPSTDSRTGPWSELLDRSSCARTQSSSSPVFLLTDAHCFSCSRFYLSCLIYHHLCFPIWWGFLFVHPVLVLSHRFKGSSFFCSR
jgi:hypothetical protein